MKGLLRLEPILHDTSGCGIMVRREFSGILGSETSVKCDGIPVCIGDTVEIETKIGIPYSGVVIKYKGIDTVMGFVLRSLEELNIKKIVKRYSKLNIGDNPGNCLVVANIEG